MINDLKIGGNYNWKNQPERLIYSGYNFSGNGHWHQFAKVEKPDEIWCEVQSADLHMFEETKAENANDEICGTSSITIQLSTH